MIKKMPQISRFEATAPTISSGASTFLSWAVKDVSALSLDPGNLNVFSSSGPGYEVKPAATTTYILKAVGTDGLTATRELTIKVVPPPLIDSLKTEPVKNSADAITVIAEFSGGMGELKDGSTVLASSDTSPLRHQLSSVKPGMNLVFTVTNEARSTFSRSLQFAVSNKQP
jgi:hypothetical protein